MRNDDQLRQAITAAMDGRLALLTPTQRQKDLLTEQITGGKPMKRNMRISMGLVLAAVLTLLAVGAMAAALLSAREVIEQTAVPLAIENDTEARKTGSYTHAQLVTLVKTANENGITLDETTGIMQALRKGDGYWEDEAIMEICREAFGGLVYEWTYEEQYWFYCLMAEMNGNEKPDMDYPGEGDLPAREARQIADEAVKKAYPGAKDLDDPACYRRMESFFRTEWEEGIEGSQWRFTYKALDLTHAEYFASVNEKGEIVGLSETPQDWSRYTVSQLENGVSNHYRARTGTKTSWSQEAWHAYREMLPGAERDGGWRAEHDAYLKCGYPLPDENDMTAQAALAVALKDAGMTESELNSYDKVLLADETGRRLWKITLFRPDNFFRAVGKTETSWEIDAKTGEIIARADWTLGDRIWRGYVLETAYREAVAGLLTGDEALHLAADALRKELREDGIPYTDPEQFTAGVSFNEWSQKWQVSFRTKTLAYATGAVTITEPDHQVTVTNSAPSQVDGDSLWGRYQQVYGASRWQQETWVRFGRDMQNYQPREWIGRLLKNTEYPEESAVKLTRAQAVDIAFAHNDEKGDEELDATLIGAAPHPVWKVALSDRECIQLYEIDAETGEVLDKEKYAPDNREFDHPVKRYTLHRAFAPVYAETFGPERLAVIEICKAFGDLSFDDPIATVLGADMDSESLSDEIVEYTADVAGRTVTIRPDRQGMPVYRVTFDENWMTVKAEKLTD